LTCDAEHPGRVVEAEGHHGVAAERGAAARVDLAEQLVGVRGLGDVARHLEQGLARQLGVPPVRHVARPHGQPVRRGEQPVLVPAPGMLAELLEHGRALLFDGAQELVL
jgi:hypothetical protein